MEVMEIIEFHVTTSSTNQFITVYKHLFQYMHPVLRRKGIHVKQSKNADTYLVQIINMSSWSTSYAMRPEA
jgi:hypothetical protein